MNAASPLIFDRFALRRHLARARPHFGAHSALFDEAAAQIDDRLSAVRRDFIRPLDLSPFPFLTRGDSAVTSSSNVTFDEEFLPFAPESFDLIASNLSLHWVNDVPGALAQIRQCLQKDGLFVASLPGGHSLHELRASLMEAELQVTGGVSPRLSPTIDLLTASTLLQRAGFTLPVVDKENVTLLYSDMFALMHDLRSTGQTNAHKDRPRHMTRRAVFFEAAKLYQEKFGNENGHIPATFEIIHLHGWK